MTVLDLGGTTGFWRHMQLTPADLTLVNLGDFGPDMPGVREIIGDATRPPRITFDRSYDLVVANSVIDQVGGIRDRRRFAEVIRTAGRFYWVQTANRWFPIDAYFLFPYFSALPIGIRTQILRHWRLAPGHNRDPEKARGAVRSIELQTRKDMRALFPDATLIVERFAGLAKSLIATNHRADAVIPATDPHVHHSDYFVRTRRVSLTPIEEEALHRLLDAHLRTDESDPLEAQLRAVMAKLERGAS